MNKQIVLVPGPWMGAWCWEAVRQHLRGHGHDAQAVTLPGLASEREDVSHIGLETHVAEVMALLEERDLRDVVLVGHSYSGLVAGQVADRLPDRVAHTVFVEGFLPHDGRSMLHAFPERLREDELRQIAAHGGRWPAPDAAVVGDGQGLTARQAHALARRFVGHPGRTVSDPVKLSRPLAAQRATYVVCSLEHLDGRLADDVAAMRAEPTWDFETLHTGHWPMISAPGPLADLLAGIAGRATAPEAAGERRRTHEDA